MNRPTPTRPFPSAAKFLTAKVATAVALATWFALPGCSNGGDTSGEVKPVSDFVVLRTEPAENGTLFLNEPIRIDFSQPVDLDSVDLTTFSFQVIDQLGNVVAEPPAGGFQLDRAPGDSEVGRRLQFIPRLPTNDTFSNGGFRPGRTYIVQLVGGSRLNGTVVRDTRGRGLQEPVTFRFRTADGTTLDQLFRNTVPGGPLRTNLIVTPTPDVNGVVLNKLGAPPVEVRLGFNQPLNPSSTNVPVALDTDPLVRDANNRGRIFLEYDDPDPLLGVNRWIPADVELESNTFTGATVLLRPLGVLPNNATIRVKVARDLEDISGESNTANASYQTTFGTFKTRRSYEQQFDSLVEEFTDTDKVDFAAPFAEPVAEVGPGYVKAGFAFEGQATSIEFDPEATTTVLNTNFTQVVPKVGSAYNVSGGVFNFKTVRIREGRTVEGQGSNPMVWLVSDSFTVEGTLSVAGKNGTLVTSTGTADEPKAGGFGQCGGGDGGAGSPSATVRDEMGGTGRGPLQATGQGGTGGQLACLAGCSRGSGGGGGSFATQGDPNYKLKLQPPGTFPVAAPTNVQPILQQQIGIGGFGCLGAAGAVSRILNAGVAGPVVFTDTRRDNDFWGQGLDFRRNLRITGELSVPMGGGGGGGGGDLSINDTCTVTDPNFLNDSSGGGGGGGGGVLIVKALGPIVISETGRITADGGYGGGGESGGASNKGGGGGGGAGGMVVLMSATQIQISAHGGTYAANDYNFSISADGGACRTGAATLQTKYPAGLTSSNTTFLTTYDAAPLGGFGGMGIVQLMAPTGANVDNTNTVLDDNIRVMQGQNELTGTAKQAMLAWRGFPDALGVGRDDFNNPTNIGDNEGDIRPAPVLLPVPFGTKSRLRSRWIDTGSAQRRALGGVDDDLPRGLLTPSGTGILPGPRYEFAGVNPATGLASVVIVNGKSKVQYPAVGTPTGISLADTGSSFLGKPAYRVELVAASLGDVADRYAGYEAEALSATDAVVGSFRVLAHTNRVLTLSPESGAWPTNATKIQLRAKFFRVVTNGEEGLGGTILGSGGLEPAASLRIGFAFHKDPASSTAPRYPATAGSFAYDLSDPAVQEAVRSQGLTFVQWDLTFDGQFAPGTARPELHWLRLPFRF